MILSWWKIQSFLCLYKWILFIIAHGFPLSVQFSKLGTNISDVTDNPCFTTLRSLSLRVTHVRIASTLVGFSVIFILGNRYWIFLGNLEDQLVFAITVNVAPGWKEGPLHQLVAGTYNRPPMFLTYLQTYNGNNIIIPLENMYRLLYNAEIPVPKSNPDSQI